MNENIEINPFKRKFFFKIFLFILVFFSISFYLYISYIEPKLLLVNEKAVVIDSLPEEFNGFKIVHFSDIYYGSSINDVELKSIVKKINELKPDVIVFTGDLFNSSINLKEDSFENIKNILQELSATFNKYAVVGNSDYTNKEKYLEIMNNVGFKILDNENDLLYYKGNNPIQFIGTSSLLEGENDINKALGEDKNDYFRIWLNHEPIILDNLIDKEIRPNILLTGHTLGELVDLPFKGYLLKQDGIANYTEDFYHKKKINMYVSNGLGTYKYDIRFMNMPSINFYRLYNK